MAKVEVIELPPLTETNLALRDECKNCTFRTMKKCRILSDTDFGERTCPFHKTLTEKRESLKRSKVRLLAIGYTKDIND